MLITMYNNAKSVDASKRCIESAKQYGYTNIMSFRAITPEDNPRKIFEENKDKVRKAHQHPTYGFSVRCIKKK